MNIINLDFYVISIGSYKLDEFYVSLEMYIERQILINEELITIKGNYPIYDVYNILSSRLIILL